MARTLKSDPMLFWSTLLMIGVSLVMVYSASAQQQANAHLPTYSYLLRQAAWVVLGLPLLLGGMRLDYRVYRQPALIWALVAVTVVALASTFFFGVRNGTQRWILVYGLSFQPSELAKFVAIVFAAALLERRMHRIQEPNYALLPIVIVTTGLAALIIVEPDFGTAVMLVVAVCAVVFAAGLSYRHLLTAAAILIPTGIGLIFAAGYRTERLLVFLDASRDPSGVGFQSQQSIIAVGSGGALGKGVMAGVQKVFYIPEPHTDFIYAVIGEELGLIGCTAVLACFVVIAWRGFRAALLAPDRFGALLGIGLSVMMSVQALINISVILGMLPTKGIPLPFASYGGSSLLVNLLAMGILLNISQGSPGRLRAAGASLSQADASAAPRARIDMEEDSLVHG